MDSSKGSYERQFRSVLLRACEDMGEEKWKSFLFLLSVPERVREKGRSDVLSYLVENGNVSSEKPQELASLLRLDLRRDDLAVRVEEFMKEWEKVRSLPAPTAESVASLPQEPPAETVVQRPAVLPTAVETRQKRRTHSPDRRYAKVFTPAEVENTLQLRDLWTRGETTPTVETRVQGHNRLGMYCLPDRESCGESPIRPIEIYGTLPRRRKNDLSPGRDSNCSSGYFSLRGSVASRESVISLQTIPSTEKNVPPHTASLTPSPTISLTSPLDFLSLLDSSPTPEPPALSSLESSISSASSDDDFQSCTSGSTEDLLDSKDPAVCCDAHPPLTLSERGVRKSSPEVVRSPTYSNIRRRVTVQMCLEQKDILRDISSRGSGRNTRMYQSYPPFPQQRSGLQFQMRFYPTNLHHNAAALYIDVVSVRDRGVASIPPLDITVSVCDSKSLAQHDSTTMREEDCIAFDSYSSQGGCLFNKECIALFPQLLSHKQLRNIVGDAVVVQVVMEYSPL